MKYRRTLRGTVAALLLLAPGIAFADEVEGDEIVVPTKPKQEQQQPRACGRRPECDPEGSCYFESYVGTIACQELADDPCTQAPRCEIGAACYLDYYVDAIECQGELEHVADEYYSYNWDYWFALTRALASAPAPAAARTPGFILTVPLDAATLPFAALAGAFE